MSISQQSYRNFEGPTTPEWSRSLVLARYALKDAFASRVFTVFFFVCLLWPLACAVLIYLRYNAEALAILELSLADLFSIDAHTFRIAFMDPQSAMSFVVVLVMAPSLISPDLRNNALPLLLARPLTKFDYVVGKLAVLALVLSAITWVPGFLLFFLQSYLEGGGWMFDNFRALFGMFFGFWAWILALSLLGLALSSWVKWKPLARILLLGLIGVTSGMGTSFNLIYRTWFGSLLDIEALRSGVYDHLFGMPEESAIPSWAAWLGLMLVSAASAWLLSRRVKAYEVVS